MRRISTVNLYNSKYSYTGQVLEPFYREELIFNGKNLDQNGYRVITSKGSQRFGFNVTGKNSLGNNSFGYIGIAGPPDGDNDRHGDTQYEDIRDSKAGDENGDITVQVISKSWIF